MGCISSKNARPGSPDLLHLYADLSANAKRRNRLGSRSSSTYLSGPLERTKAEADESLTRSESLRRGSSRRSFSFKLGKAGALEAAGWPAWLIDVAGEAIEGWLPLSTDAFERLDKIGQGTYSDVYRAREISTGRMVAIKKVRFDSMQPESVKFMAREIQILRKLSHPNVMKLEGIITPSLSNNIYLVFEYMEHDLAGLLASPNVRFTEAQIKCLTQQILSGIEHIHSQGILHRDIKTSNILVNNEGVVKLADFGLANFMAPINTQPLTSRVVTLWYRSPELLLGSNDYGEAIDLWSVGCVFSELFIGRPILKGRTEVEQLHKIFKLCGSPSEEYWGKSKLPLAHMFKPQNPYESTLRERCKELPKTAVNLIETFLAIEPHNRGTASSALNSKYFNTRPYACDPSDMPKYPPSKEMGAKLREEQRRKRRINMAQMQGGSQGSRRLDHNPHEPSEDNHITRGTQGDSANTSSMKQKNDAASEASVPPPASSSGSQRELPKLLQGISALVTDEEENDGSSIGTMHMKPATSNLPNVDAPNEPYQDAGNKKKKGRVAFSGPVIHHYEVGSDEHDHPLQPYKIVCQRSRLYQDR